MDTKWLADHGIALDRGAEVPIGLQLTWALRSAIETGQLIPGQRLPGAQELAEAVGVNVNTLRSAINRLEADGFLEARHGSGTFVAHGAPQRANLATLVDDVARAARNAGMDPRELAGALYGVDARPAKANSGARERRELRQQIALLDRLHADLARTKGEALGTLAPDRRTRTGEPRLLTVTELRAQRDALLDDIARLRNAKPPEPPEPPETAPAAVAPERPKRRATKAAAPRAQPA